MKRLRGRNACCDGQRRYETPTASDKAGSLHFHSELKHASLPSWDDWSNQSVQKPRERWQGALQLQTRWGPSLGLGPGGGD